MSLPAPLEPTRRRSIVSAAVLGAALTVLTLTVVDSFDLTAPEVPWTTPLLLGVAAIAGAAMARITWLRNRIPGRRADPRQAVATLALARAMLLAGAAFVGGYLAFALFHLPRWDAPAPRARVVVGLVAMVVSLGLVAAGWALEYACRVPRRDDDDADTEP